MVFGPLIAVPKIDLTEKLSLGYGVSITPWWIDHYITSLK
jgi:hypothetical protein